MLNKLTFEMIEYYTGDPKRIQHFLKVRELARLIAMCEGVDEKTLFTIEAAAIVHDVGIKIGEKLYGKCTGKQQEQLGAPMAKRMLANNGFPADVTERVNYLVGHHHTYDNIDGIDLQILIEADMLVNLYEDNVSIDGILSAFDSVLKTNTGKLVCRQMFRI